MSDHEDVPPAQPQVIHVASNLPLPSALQLKGNSSVNWTRMPFVISPAPEEFQRRLDTALPGLQLVVPIFDDILIYGVGETKAEAIENHDQRLITLLERCKSKGIKLNKEKCKFRLSEVSFTGHVISEEGLKPDPAKIQGVQDMPTPESKQDVKRLLCMVNYLQKFASKAMMQKSTMRRSKKNFLPSFFNQNGSNSMFKEDQSR